MLLLTQHDPLKGKRIGVIGASRHKEKYGYKVFKDLLEKGYTVFAVNPHNGTLLGKRVYTSLHDLIEHEGKPDMLLFIIPPAAALAVLREAVKLGIHSFWFQPGSESRDIITLCSEKNLDCTYGMCIMRATDQHA